MNTDGAMEMHIGGLKVKRLRSIDIKLGRFINEEIKRRMEIQENTLPFLKIKY